MVEMSTDKAVVEVPAPVTGRVVALTGGPATWSRVGAELVVFETEARVARARPARRGGTGRGPGCAAAATPRPAGRGRARQCRPPARPRPQRQGRVMASPATRRRAQRSGHRPRAGRGQRPGRPHHARDLERRWRGASRAATRERPRPQRPPCGARDAHRHRGDQGHRRAARDRAAHDRGQAQHPALRLRRGSGRHRTRVAAPAPERDGAEGRRAAHLPAVPDRGAGARARAVPAVQRLVRRRAQRGPAPPRACTSAWPRRRRTASRCRWCATPRR